MTNVARTLFLVVALAGSVGAQTFVDPRPLEPPPTLDNFDTDEDGDGVPDHWYNLRDARVIKGGIGDGVACLRFENTRPSRPARASRAFNLDGRETGGVTLGLWVRGENLRGGSRVGEDAALSIDFLDDGRQILRHGSLGPWTKTIGPRWTRVARRIAVPPGTRDVIMTVGLLGATGVLEVDSLTFDLEPVGGSETTNLLRNGDFELGDPKPTGWVIQENAHRTYPGHHSASCLEFPRGRGKALAGLAGPIDPGGGELLIRLSSWSKGLRESGGAEGTCYFLDASGDLLKGDAERATAFRWSGSTDWQDERATVRVPVGASAVILQFETFDPTGILRIDDVSVTTFTNPGAGTWPLNGVEDETSDWVPFVPGGPIVEGSALDASVWLDAPAGAHGRVTVRDHHFAYEDGRPARFFGVSLLAPTAFQTTARADALADRLSRSGVNLVRLGDLDASLGPGRSLFDDTRDDTKALDPESLSRLDHLLAALKRRGIAYALELQGARRFRAEDDVPSAGKLPPGGGPAAAFDHKVRALAIEGAKALLGHVNAETGLALKDDPSLAWITLAGELSLFDLTEDPDALPAEVDRVHRPAGKRSAASHRRAWQLAEAAQWKAEAEALRAFGVKAPLAGNSHWRRETEFNAAQIAPGLDLIDDRLYWTPPPWANPDHRTLLVEPGGFLAEAARKRRADRPYVVGQWCAHTDGSWALPYEGADLLYATQVARSEDWDALVRRGVFLYPTTWGAAATGTGGVDDIFPIPESLGGNPQVFALLPHASSIYLRDRDDRTRALRPKGRPSTRNRLIVDSPHTLALAGWTGKDPAETEDLRFEVRCPYAVVAATAMGSEPISRTKRLLVTAVARVQPTGFRWADMHRAEVADPGRPPLLVEPIDVTVHWRRAGKVRGFALDNTGARVGPAPLVETPDGARLDIRGATHLHWELIVE